MSKQNINSQDGHIDIEQGNPGTIDQLSNKPNDDVDQTIEDLQRENIFLKNVLLKYSSKTWHETVEELYDEIACLKSTLPGLSVTNSIYTRRTLLNQIRDGCQNNLPLIREKILLLQNMCYDIDQKWLYMIVK